jgi:DNA-binding response OmpR family regulator
MDNNTAHILVVDDDEYLSDIIKETLEAENYTVTIAYDGQSALKAVSASGIHLVLLDIKLPDISGFTVLEKIREQTDIPVIMLTGITDTDTLAQSIDMGADDYIRKPFLPQELLARVKAKLRRRANQQAGRD